VDDEKLIAFTLSAILEGAGYNARAFSDPFEALRAAETNCPDLLISDVMMPALNGVDLAIQFKAIYPNVRVLLFSGVLMSDLVVGGAKAKGHHFEMLPKPIHPTELLTAIGTISK
jgi:CheY-like chemotaxis protein